VHLDRDDPRFGATVVGLGAMGVVARLTLRVEPTFDITQTVMLDLPMAVVRERLHELFGLAYSVSLFTEWRDDQVSQIWIKQRAGELFDTGVLAGATAAERPMHPIVGVDAAACTDQSAVAGPWHERLPHFRPDHQPSAGAELQSECFVDRADAPAALDALRKLAPVLAPLVLVSEFRSIAGDDLWLSMASGRDSVGFHFTWRLDVERVLPVLAQVEQALEPFAPRPHWGKLTTMSPTTIRSRYERFDDAMNVRRAGDPQGTFLNRYVSDIAAPGDA
jgi:xylitol oxidase